MTHPTLESPRPYRKAPLVPDHTPLYILHVTHQLNRGPLRISTEKTLYFRDLAEGDKARAELVKRGYAVRTDIQSLWTTADPALQNIYTWFDSLEREDRFL